MIHPERGVAERLGFLGGRSDDGGRDTGEQRESLGHGREANIKSRNRRGGRVYSTRLVRSPAHLRAHPPQTAFPAISASWSVFRTAEESKGSPFHVVHVVQS